MAFDPGLAERIAALVGVRPEMEERRMFGGIVWMLNGNMCFGIERDNLIIRVGVDTAEKILEEELVKPMDFTGKVMKGWATVLPDGFSDDEELKRFMGLAIEFVGTLPVK